MAFPNLPGVPQLLPTAKTATSAVFGVIQATGWRYISNPKSRQWGIFEEVKDGNKINLVPLFSPEPIFSADKAQLLNNAALKLASTLGLIEEASFNAMDYSKEWRVSNFPIEGGGFASYNKVELPGDVVVTMCMGGSNKEQKRFLDTINEAAGSLKTYSIVTPKAKYINYNINRYAYSHRSDSGADLLIVAIDITEVRAVTAVRKIGEKLTPSVKAKEAAGNSPKDSGRVQTSKPSKSILKNLSDSILKPAADLAAKKLSAIKSRFFNGSN